MVCAPDDINSQAISLSKSAVCSIDGNLFSKSGVVFNEIVVFCG